MNQLSIHYSVSTRRLLSTEAKAPLTQADKVADDDNIFLDNLGKIFGLVIASIILAVVRSSRQGTLKTAVRDGIEAGSQLDPGEIEEFRECNVDFTGELYRTVVKEVYDAYPVGKCSYSDFIGAVLGVVRRETNDPTNTIMQGHYLDRVVMKSEGYEDGKLFDVGFLLVGLNMAVYGTVEERVRLVMDVARREEGVGVGEGVGERTMIKVVDWLAETCQLPADNRVVEVGSAYPLQHYGVASGEDIVNRVRVPLDANKAEEARAAFGGKGERVGEEEWARIMKSRQGPCPWGECYEGLRRLI